MHLHIFIFLYIYTCCSHKYALEQGQHKYERFWPCNDPSNGGTWA